MCRGPFLYHSLAVNVKFSCGQSPRCFLSSLAATVAQHPPTGAFPPGDGHRDVPAFDLPQRMRFLDITKADAARVQPLLAHFREFADQFVEEFYRHLFAFDETAQFLKDPDLVVRLKRSQQEHLESMLEASWDQAYVQQRLRVGNAHAESGIEPQFFLGAYNQYIQRFVRYLAADRHVEEPLLEQVLSLVKVILFDIGLTLDAYFLHSTERLRSALDMLLKSNTELRHFAQLTSHDLKTPLATVANLCDEALDEFRSEMPEGACHLIEAAKQRTYRMSAMIDELLAVTSDEAMESTEELSSVTVLEEALERVKPVLAQKGIIVQVAEGLPRVWGNRVRLREAFYNLLSNAAKFTDTRPGRIWVGFQANDQQCVFEIADNGPGIPREELERIFVPFRRLPAHRDRPGSGLGLYFTKNLIEQQGGKVWAESEVGQGSRFFVQLRRNPR